jgi:hypothetical protein
MVHNNNGHAVTDVLPPNSDQSQVASAPAPVADSPDNIAAYGPNGHLNKRSSIGPSK